MATFKDEKRNTWYVSVRYINWQGEHKRKVKRGFVTKRDASTWERKFLQEQKMDMHMSFQQLVEMYFSDKEKRLKQSSLDVKRFAIEANIVPYFQKAVMDIKPFDILKWQNAMIDKGYSDTYLSWLQKNLCAIFNHAEKFYELNDNPCRKIESIGRSKPPEMNFWTYQEFEKFIQTIPAEDMAYKMIFLILFWSGLRCGEVLALTKTDIDTENNAINVNKTFYRRKGEDNITEPKTPKSNRTVIIPQFLSGELKEYMDRLYGLNDKDRIFCFSSKINIQNRITKKSKEAGVKRIRTHDLRHSHIAMLIEKGVSPLAIAERVGHESINTTMNRYGHLYPNKQQEIADMLNKEQDKGN